jgi:hypothetical protein
MVSSLGVRDQGLGAGGSFEKYLLLINSIKGEIHGAEKINQ